MKSDLELRDPVQVQKDKIGKAQLLLPALLDAPEDLAVSQTVERPPDMSQVLRGQCEGLIHCLVVPRRRQVQRQAISGLLGNVDDHASVRVVNHWVLHRDPQTL